MSAVNFESVLSRLPQYHGKFFDEKAPGNLICPITDNLMQEPLAVNCRSGHVFEKAKLTHWLSTHSTCPLDHLPVTATYRTRTTETHLQDWVAQHAVEPIEPKQLAHTLLFGAPAADPASCAKTNAYLRFIGTANLTHEVAQNVIQMVEKNGGSTSRLQDLLQVRALRGEAMILNQIVREAESALGSKLSSPSSKLLEHMEGSQTRTMEALEQIIHKMALQDEEVQRTRDQMQQMVKIQQAVVSLTGALGIQEAKPGPLTLAEKVKLALHVVGPPLLCAMSRGTAAYMDHDPKTLFADEFWNCSFSQVALGVAQLFYICHEGRANGTPGLRKISNQITSWQYAMTLMTVVNEYNTTLTRGNAAFEEQMSSQTVSGLNDQSNATQTEFNELNATQTNQKFDTLAARLDALKAAQQQTIQRLDAFEARLEELKTDHGARLDALEANTLQYPKWWPNWLRPAPPPT